MKFKPNKLQTYSFVASMPIIDFLLNYIIYNDRIFHSINIWLVSFPLIFGIGILSWATHVLISEKIKMNYPGLKSIGSKNCAACILPDTFHVGVHSFHFPALRFTSHSWLHYEHERSENGAGSRFQYQPYL